MEREVFIGYDPRERKAFDACVRSLLAHAREPVPIRPISRAVLGQRYGRPTEVRDGKLWDTISCAPMATDFSLARFWVPVESFARTALYVDCDFLFRADVAELFEQFDDRYAVQVVKHAHEPAEAEKMDGQVQTRYPRKNWSSCVLWNLRHAAARRAWLGDLNTMQGLWLQGFQWVQDHEIGELPAAWNWLDGTSDPDVEAKAVHFTRGTPDMNADCDMRYTDEWWRYAS